MHYPVSMRGEQTLRPKMCFGEVSDYWKLVIFKKTHTGWCSSED